MADELVGADVLVGEPRREARRAAATVPATRRLDLRAGPMRHTVDHGDVPVLLLPVAGRAETGSDATAATAGA